MRIHSQSIRLTILVLALITGFQAGQSQLINTPTGQISIPGASIPKWVDPLPRFVVGETDLRVKGTDLEVSMVPHTQRILPVAMYPAGVPGTDVWAYSIHDKTNGVTRGPLYPAFTIEAQRNAEVKVKYINSLTPDLYQYLVVDQSLHWANPDGVPMMYEQPDMTMLPNTTPYSGSVPAVVHLHGGEVPAPYDGGPDSWWLANGSKKGHAFVTNIYKYANTQEATTLFFHDHTLGATRLNLYAGLAGFYLLRDAANEPAGLPTGEYEVELAIQDRMFDTNGQLFFFAVGQNPTIHPYWFPEFFGDVIVVNGKSWPFLDVKPRKYRFRIVNGSNARFYEMIIQNRATSVFGPSFVQIGTDGGYLNSPVTIDAALNQRLLLAPGERADVVVDFKNYAGQTLTIRNFARSPYPKGAPADPQTTGQILQFRVQPGPVVDPGTVPGNLRPANPIEVLSPASKVLTRQLTLNEVMGPLGPVEALLNNEKWDSPTTEVSTEGTTELWEIANLTGDAHPIHLHLVQYQILNRQSMNLSKYNKAYTAAFPAGRVAPDWMMGGMMMTYPAGVYVPASGPPLAYSTPNADGAVGGNPPFTPYVQGPLMPPQPNEKGWKDTFVMYPGEVTRVLVRFAPQDANATAKNYYPFDPSLAPGYVWHCHIVDHEDNEMMRRTEVLAAAGAPARPFTFELPDITPVAAAAGAAATAAANDEMVAERSTGMPEEYSLFQNYPNPFNPSTEIRFALPEDNHVRLTLYNSLGQEVKTLIDADAKAGYHSVRFDAGNLASGTYFYRIQSGNFVSMKKMLLLK